MKSSRQIILLFLRFGSISPLINGIAGRPAQNDEMQGGRILRNEAYLQYAACLCVSARIQVRRTGRKDEAQHRRSRFSTAC